MEIVRKYLSSSDVGSKIVRYNVDCNCVQFSPDDGLTWIEDAPLDPRTSAAYQLAADPTTNPQCDAAERAINLLHEELDTVVSALTAVQAVNLLFDTILVFIPGFGIIASVIWIAVEALIFIGQTAIDTSFTDAVYANLKCLWVANVGADGIMTTEGLSAWQDDVQSAYPTDGVIAASLSVLVDNFGLVQLNNAAVKRVDTGDCTDCNCPTALGGHGQAFTAETGDSYSHYGPGNDWYTGAVYTDPQSWYVQMWVTPPTDSALVSLTVHNDFDSGVAGNFRIFSDAYSLLQDNTHVFPTGGASEPPVVISFDFVGGTTYLFQFWFVHPANNLSGHIVQVKQLAFC